MKCNHVTMKCKHTHYPRPPQHCLNERQSQFSFTTLKEPQPLKSLGLCSYRALLFPSNHCVCELQFKWSSHHNNVSVNNNSSLFVWNHSHCEHLDCLSIKSLFLWTKKKKKKDKKNPPPFKSLSVSVPNNSIFEGPSPRVTLSTSSIERVYELHTDPISTH